MSYLKLALCLVLIGLVNSKPSPNKHKPHKFIWDEYQILAFVGKPIQPVQLILDISSSDIWVYSDDCKNCPALNKAIKSQKSSNEAFELNFTTEDNEKSGSVEGEVTSDYLLLVPDYNTKTEKHKLALINKIDGADETVDPYGQKQDGRIGLGLDSGSKTSSVDLFFGSYDKLLCLLRGDGELISSKLTLGQKMLDKTAKYSLISSSKVVDSNDGLWVIQLDGYSFGKYSSSVDYRAQLSTTTSFVGVPPTLYKQIVQLLLAYEENGNLLMNAANKAKAPTLELELNGKTLTLKPEDYIDENGPTASEFIVKIRKTTSKNDFVLGTAFLDSLSFCLNFDTQTVDLLNVTGFKWDN